MNNKISLNIIKKNNLIIFILLALGVFHIACHAQNDDTDADKNTTGSEISGNQDIHKSFDVQKGQKLNIYLETGGSISITGWENNEVNINAVFGGQDRNDIVVEMNKNNSGLEITSKYKHQHDSENSKAHFDIKVPYKFDLDINTMGGNLTLEGVNGKITGQTMGGGLTLSHLKGYLDLSTMGGNISLNGSEVDGKVHTMGGIVEFEDIIGDVNGSSMGGQVIMKNVRKKNGVSNGD